MRIISLILIFTLSQLPPSKAQENKFAFGVFGGPTYVTYFGNAILDAYRQPQFAFSTGLSSQFNINKHWSIKAGIAFEQKGIKSKFPTFTSESIYSISKMNYFTMPVLCKFTYGEKLIFFTNAGIYSGLFINEISIIYGDGIQKSKNKSNSTSLEKFDYGAVLGFGFGKKFKNNLGVSFELRANYGFKNLAKSKSVVYLDGTIQSFNACGLFEVTYSIFNKSSKKKTK